MSAKVYNWDRKNCILFVLRLNLRAFLKVNQTDVALSHSQL